MAHVSEQNKRLLHALVQTPPCSERLGPGRSLLAELDMGGRRFVPRVAGDGNWLFLLSRGICITGFLHYPLSRPWGTRRCCEGQNIAPYRTVMIREVSQTFLPGAGLTEADGDFK